MQITPATPRFPSRAAKDEPIDSATNVLVLDAVDFGKFQGDKIFTQDNAAVLAALATASYSKLEHQKEHLDAQPAVRSFRFLDSKDNASLGIPAPDTSTQVSLVETDKALLVAARGTVPPWDNEDGSDDMEWKDFQEDFAAVPVDNYDKSAKVHMGFKDAADGIWDQLKPKLQAALAAHKAIHMSGHSLGAAIALQLADRMFFEMHEIPHSVVRLGGPDVGWEDEKKHLEKVGLTERTFNFVNCTDPVPHLVPNGVAAGREVYLDRHGRVDISGKSHKLDQALGAAEDVWHGHADPTHHHVPQLYCQHIGDPQNAPNFKPLEH